MKPNFIAIAIATIIPILVGFVWYSPKLGFGKAWMQVTGITEEDGKKANMALIFGLTLLFSFMMALVMQMLVIHQIHTYSLLNQQKDFAEANSLSSSLLKQFMDNYANSYRTFKHGAFHGTIAGIFLALPIIAIPALFENKGAKYIAINAGYWVVSMALMGAVVCGMM